MADLTPNRWSRDLAYFKLELADLKRNIQSVAHQRENFFPYPMDAVSWRVVSVDGGRQGKAELDDIGSLFDQIDDDTVFFHIKLYHREATGILNLDLIPTFYLECTVDFARRHFKYEISTVGLANADKLRDLLTKGLGLVDTNLPMEHRYLESYLEKFFQDHATYERNVFLITRLQEQKPFPEIITTIQRVCATRGLSVLRADDRAYTDDLWDNVMTYMYGCSSAIALFDQINSRDFNPNVALEVGFMLSLRKPVLLLKDQAIVAMPTDIIGKIYRPFDTYDAASTIPPQLEKWLLENELGEERTF